MASPTVTPGSHVTRADLEAKFRELQGEAREQVASARGTLVAVGGVVAVVLALIVFLLGRRAGKQRTTIVEIKRI
ncbi:MAG TPA: hypothetical protein VF743_08125 [Acidimicrobiales bacterium]